MTPRAACVAVVMFALAGSAAAGGVGCESLESMLPELTPAPTPAPTPMPVLTVRVMYAVPADREFREDYRAAIETAIADVQRWYREQLGGSTFRSQPIEDCLMPNETAFYERAGAWDLVLGGVQHCANVEWGGHRHVWVVYPDVREPCVGPLELGRATEGLAIFRRGDLEGMVSPGPAWRCDDGPFAGPWGLWVGALAHELAHAFGLGHPPGCDSGSSGCDSRAMTWLGFTAYPDTYLRPDEKRFLLQHRAFAR